MRWHRLLGVVVLSWWLVSCGQFANDQLPMPANATPVAEEHQAVVVFDQIEQEVRSWLRQQGYRLQLQQRLAVASDPASALRFYQQSLEQAGWQAARSGFSATTLAYQRDDQLVVVVALDAQPYGQTGSLLLVMQATQ